MRLENYYRLRKDCSVDYFNTLNEILMNIDFEELKEFEFIEIGHIWENYDGSYEEETIFEYRNGKVEIDKQKLMEQDKEKFANGTTLTQLNNMTKEELIETIREIDTMFNYECGCNKQLVETQDKNERLTTLLYNAITLLETDNGYDIEELITELGMTSEEYDKIIYGD